MTSREESDIQTCEVDSVSRSVDTKKCLISSSEEFRCDQILELEKPSLHDCQQTKQSDYSMSCDRRKAESAQFLEAVGELRESGRDIEILDNTGDDSQDDEDEYVYEIQRSTITPSHHHWHAHTNIDMLRSVPFTILPSTSWCESNPEDLSYRGIGQLGMEITKCGLQRGNPVTLHRKAWLEVSDSKHRYGKHLRVYYYHWCSLGHPTNNFFNWLDAKGAAEDMPLPDLPECPRKVLETDTVLYITDPKITESYSLSVITNEDSGRAMILDVNGELVRTGAEGWIFVLRDNVMYGTRKVAALTANSKQRFHHSSFFGGKAVSAAGIIVTDDKGFLTEVHPHSGHYRPGEPDIQRCLCYLYSKGVNLDTFKVDMQQIFRISRHKDQPNGELKEKCGTKKKQKKSCLHLESATFAAYFLSHKAKATKERVFELIKRRQYMHRDLSEESFGSSDSSSTDEKNACWPDRPIE